MLRLKKLWRLPSITTNMTAMTMQTMTMQGTITPVTNIIILRRR
jgi:hypothetical protein